MPESYSEIISHTNLTLSQLRKKEKPTPYLRFLLAVIILFLICYRLSSNENNLLWIPIILGLIFFLILLNYHQKLLTKIRLKQNVILVCKNELLAKDGLYENFKNGIEFESSSHSFAADLDIFKTLFLSLNRTFSTAGKNLLAQKLQDGDKANIIKNQAAVVNLSINLNWIVLFLAISRDFDDDFSRLSKLKHWLLSDVKILKPSYTILRIILPIFNALMVLFLIFNFIGFKIYLISFIIQVLVWKVNKKENEADFEAIKSQSKSLEQYKYLFQHIQKNKFSAELLLDITKTNENAEKSISELLKICKNAEMRNLPLGFPFYILFGGDWRAIYKLNAWQNKNKLLVLNAIENIQKLEFLVSLTCFSVANPSFTFPILSNNKILDAKNLGHPLIKNCIKNDINFNQNEKIYITTGANMAGKSTFLRSVGVNLVLAKMGSVVCAERFEFKPLALFSCMRISDSIDRNESYFQAELLRLKEIVMQLETGLPLFVLLDELLKGTNSKDKLEGSELFLKKILSFDVYGFIAMHDLELTKIVEEFPNTIKNICFEVSIDNQKMIFDYKLKNGVTKNMNALFLMQKMKII